MKSEGLYLENILIDCKEGDVLRCVRGGNLWKENEEHVVVCDPTGTDGLGLTDKGGSFYYSSVSLFIKVDKPAPKGDKLRDILPRCKEGDLLECVKGSEYFTASRNYRTVNRNGTLFIEDDEGDLVYNSLKSTFIKVDKQPAKDEHDTWGIGKQYKAPKKEWQPDVMDVDLTKKIWEW